MQYNSYFTGVINVKVSSLGASMDLFGGFVSQYLQKGLTTTIDELFL